MHNFNSLGSVLDRMTTLSQAVDDAFTPNGRYAAPRARRPQFLVPVDWYETENAYVIEADIPGIDPKDVEISFEQNALTIRGARPVVVRGPEDGEVRIYSAERLAGEFSRVVRLPDSVDGEKIAATHANGVLKVVVPKAAAARARKIELKQG